MRQPCTGVILAGGLSTRYGGRNKALLQVGGRCILDRLFEVFRGLFAETILVTNRPEEFLEWDVFIVTDLFAVRSSLTGIHTGLFYARQPHAFFAACDTPFLQRGVVEAVLEGIEPAVDLVIPRTAAGLEPLCAAYSKRCLRSVEDHLRRGLFKIQWALANKRIREIPEEVLRRRDPELRSFFNVNTPEDLARAEALAAAERAEGER